MVEIIVLIYKGEGTMIPVEEYAAQLLENVAPLSARLTSIDDALGCVLAEDLTARESVPRFTNSAMDGFAIRIRDFDDLRVEKEIDVPLTLPVVGDIAAGDNRDYVCEKGTAYRIMTGARMPMGADTVVKIEDTDAPRGIASAPHKVTIKRIPPLGSHVRRIGQDCAAGDVVLPAGTVMTPAALSSAVSVGYAHVPIRPCVKVGIITTGDELVDAGQVLAASQIPDSNSVLLRGLLEQAGARIVSVGRTQDNPEDFSSQLMRTCAKADLIVTSGGISADAFDVVKAAAGKIGLSFSQVAMQPGKPQGFGQVHNGAHSSWLCALPGNPVAVFVSFHVFVRPLLAKLAGNSNPSYAPSIAASTSAGWTSPAGKRQFVPVRIRWSERSDNIPMMDPTHRLGLRSHFVASLHAANGLAIVPESVTNVQENDVLEVIMV
ncbi:MAG: molybdopterin molybdotransferase MoeA [Actinomycetaceae bacterium]|nr:molybdopterin molybdotransferase MoeA [Actinomycetaceae bacterium]